MWWKKHKWKALIPVLIAAVLVGVFYYGSNAPGARGWTVSGTPAPADDLAPANLPESPEIIPEIMPTDKPEKIPLPTDSAKAGDSPAASKTSAAATKAPKPAMEINPETGKDKYQTDPVPEGKPLPVEPQDVKISSTAYTCTLSISCSTILNNMSFCNPEKAELVPEDGWILKPVTVTFYEGESVFNVLQRTCKQLKIHMEYENTPIYNSAYIEGIHNLYEFDVGELSGWMYKVNEWFPNYGCSRYQLKDGDIINWVYTCDLGYLVIR